MQQRLLGEISELARANGYQIYLVGGVVRDLLFERGFADQDLDFLVNRQGQEFAEIVARRIGGSLQKFDRFLTAKISSLSGYDSITEIDIASARQEHYEQPGALPTVSPATDITDDLKRRDFTINSMALELEAFLDWTSSASCDLKRLEQCVLDPFGGLTDLANRSIRILHDRSFIDDPTRCFRAYRYEQRIKGTIESHTRSLIANAINGGALKTISLNRQCNELMKILNEDQASRTLQELNQVGLLSEILPISESNRAEIIEALATIGDVPTADRWESFLAVLYLKLAPDSRDLILKSLGLGAKSIRRLATINKR